MGSVTKYQHLPKDDDSSDEDYEIKAPMGGAGEEADKDKNYARLDFVGAAVGAGGGVVRKRGGGGERNYAMIVHSEQAPPRPPIPPPPPRPARTPHIIVQPASIGEPPPRREFLT